MPACLQRLIQQVACRADEGFAGQVFLVTRLLADQHQLCMACALPADRLRGIAP